MKFNNERWGPTPKQIDLMDELGIEWDTTTTKEQATEMIQEELENRKQERNDWG